MREGDVGEWPFSTRAAGHEFGSDQWNSGRGRSALETARLTHSVTLPPSNDALRKAHPIITSSAMTGRLGRNTTRKRPSILQRVG
jgi:hypothetical protein